MMLILLQLMVLLVLSCYSQTASEKVDDKVERPNSHRKALHPGAVFILVQDWSQERKWRKCYFNKSMDSLAKHWRPHNPYPVILMETRPWTHEDMVAIRRTWDTLDFKFINIKQIFDSYPKNLIESDFEDVKKGKQINNIAYKRMCTFFMKGFTEIPLLMKYRYLLRLDDDTCLLDNINYDIFKYMQTERASYGYSHVWRDYEYFVQGMWDFVHNYVKINQIEWKNPKMYHAMLNMTHYPLSVPSFNTNFEIINTVKYRDPAVMKFVDAVIDSNMIFHRRWGDAPLRIPTAMMFWREKELVRLEGFDLQHSLWSQYNMTEHPATGNPDFQALALFKWRV
jgi:hypothetical protein